MKIFEAEIFCMELFCMELFFLELFYGISSVAIYISWSLDYRDLLF